MNNDPTLELIARNAKRDAVAQRLTGMFEENMPPQVIMDYLQSFSPPDDEIILDVIKNSIYLDCFLEASFRAYITEKVWIMLVIAATDKPHRRHWFIRRMLADRQISEHIKALTIARFSRKRFWGLERLIADRFADEIQDCLNEDIREICIKERKDCWKEGKHSISFSRRTQNMWQKIEPHLRDAIAEDQVARTEIMRNLSRHPLRVLFEYAFHREATQIVTHWLKNKRESRLGYKYHDLLLMACAKATRPMALEIVRLLEQKQPGIVKATFDSRGNNTLWWTLYHQSQRNEEGSGELVKLLETFGADPHHQNNNHLSYSAMVHANQLLKNMTDD